MQRLLSITLISITADIVYTQERQGPQICGGRLKGPVGIIQTPNFPNPFPVPIKCKWIIEHDIVNGTISIYFTQQYTTSGLTFTEYMYYDESYKLGERKALTVTEENITKNNWLQVQSPVLVVELTLDRLEGTQLRALGLLSVFGFNLTYMVNRTTDKPGPKSCSTIECRLLGHCYAKHDYKEFYCDCFEGYSGADCGVGPLCPKTPNICKNGGTCGQMGPAAVSCICAPGFTGDLCEAQIEAPECGIEECTEGCKAGACDCSPKDSDVSSARFETRLQIMDQGNINISQEIIKQITNYLRAYNITLYDEIEILNISAREATGARTIWLRVWAERRDAGALRTALAHLVAIRSRTDRLHLLPATLHFDMQPALSLHSLNINQRQEVWEGSEFILSCMAYGSPDITFTWYKDGVKINFNGTTRDIWTRTVAEDALGRRMSVLGISEAKTPDSGRWSCSAGDSGRRRCSTLRLTILRSADIRLVPSTLTVYKGDNVSITCLAGAGRMHGVLGFSWARERSLLPQVPGLAVWEDLYPAGSVLKLYNVQKSGEYRCQVSSVAGTNTKGVTMWTLSPKDEACESQASHGLRWPKTSPGAYASATCPPGHNGESVRLCQPKSIQHGVKWMVPDFSGCVADSLNDIYEQFIKISYGYSWGNISHVAHRYGAVLRSLPAQPGEGTLPLNHARNMLYYLLSNAGKPRDRQESVEHLLIIFDMLLKYPDNFLDEEKIYDLQNALVATAAMRDNLDYLYQEFAIKTKQVREDGEAHFSFISKSRSEEWLLSSAGVELVGRNGNTSGRCTNFHTNLFAIDCSKFSIVTHGRHTVVVVQYRDLTARLPSLRRTIEFNASDSRAGQGMEYQLASVQTQVTSSRSSRTAAHASTTLLFVHSLNYTTTATKLACALRKASKPSIWVTTACEVRIPEPAHVACRCRGLGTFALFTVARSTLTDAENGLRGIVKVTVGVGGALCLVALALQLLSLVAGRRARLPVLLKAATAGTHSAAVLTLLECDTTQEEACLGLLCWLCVSCWCAGCAALCAQPLLLQAELAGRRQRASSVALLAGVCTLVLLTARLYGGAPLQIGAAAQTVCAAGCAMLVVLCLVLTVCATLRLYTRTITYKSPTEMRTYLRDRRREVRHILAVLVTTSAVQTAGVWWAQPGPRTMGHVIALSAAALVNGVTMLVCYVIRDEECLQTAKRILSLPSHRDWQESPVGDTSLNLYIKQGGEAESRVVGMLESPSSQVFPVTSYWRAPGIENPARLHRSQSTPDTCADLLSPQRYDANVGGPHLCTARVSTTHAVCDLIPHLPTASQRPEYMAHVCLELGVLRTPLEPANPLLTCSVDFKPYTGRLHFDKSQDGCNIYAHSNPDVSKITFPHIKSCLKKPKQGFSSSISLPSIELKKESKSKSDIEQVNREWNKKYEAPETDRMFNKISNDLDFLLNRTQNKKIVLDQIEEAPT